MKLNELKRIVEENGKIFEVDGSEILIKDELTKKWHLHFVEETIHVNGTLYLRTSRIKKCLVALIEYSETPISEREDTKKYCFELWGGMNLKTENQYLIFDEQINKYYFDTSHRVTPETFTQQEIDNFPKEIKGAIECGFLKKVEVA